MVEVAFKKKNACRLLATRFVISLLEEEYILNQGPLA